MPQLEKYERQIRKYAYSSIMVICLIIMPSNYMPHEERIEFWRDRSSEGRLSLSVCLQLLSLSPRLSALHQYCHCVWLPWEPGFVANGSIDRRMTFVFSVSKRIAEVCYWALWVLLCRTPRIVTMTTCYDVTLPWNSSHMLLCHIHR